MNYPRVAIIILNYNGWKDTNLMKQERIYLIILYLQKRQENVIIKYKELAKRFDNLILVGRLAEYRYYDMDDAVKRALEVFEERIR